MIFRVLILLACAVNLGCSVTVELYSGQNYSGLLKKVILDPNEKGNYCFQFDQTYEVRSLKTEKCVMVYESKDCKRTETKLAEDSKLYSMRVERDTALFENDGAYPNRKEERGVQSVHFCSTEPGSGLLNVDIYSGPFYTGDLVASYEGVCECKNIPSYITLKGKPFSIDNHGKNMYFYEKEDCTGQGRLIPAGDSERSRSVTHLDTRTVVIKSFRLADGLPCPKLDASVYQFTFSSGKYRMFVTQMNMYTITNRESTTVTEYINVGNAYTLEYTVAKAFTYIHTSRVKAGFLMTSEEPIMRKLRSTLQSSLEAHYRYPNTNQNTGTIVSKPFETMSVDKPPCTTCTVEIPVYSVPVYPISYRAEATVTGVAGDDKVSAEQIRRFLPPGMEYVNKNDDYSVVVTVEGEMKGSIGNHVAAKMSCLKLPDCESHLRTDL